MTSPEKSLASEPARADSLSRLLRYASGHRRVVVLASVCSVLNKLFDIAPEILIGVAVDTVVQAPVGPSVVRRCVHTHVVQACCMMGTAILKSPHQDHHR